MAGRGFATYAETLVVAGQPIARTGPVPLAAPGDVGAPIGASPTTDGYFAIVYGKGAAALLTAR